MGRAQALGRAAEAAKQLEVVQVVLRLCSAAEAASQLQVEQVVPRLFSAAEAASQLQVEQVVPRLCSAAEAASQLQVEQVVPRLCPAAEAARLCVPVPLRAQAQLRAGSMPVLCVQAPPSKKVDGLGLLCR